MHRIRGVQYFTADEHRAALEQVKQLKDGPSQRITGISDTDLGFEDPAEAEFASKAMNGGSKPPPEQASPNRKQRRAFHSKAKKRVKQIIKQQDQRNAKYRATVKANSSGDGGDTGVGEDSVDSYLR